MRWNFWAQDPEQDREGAASQKEGPEPAVGAPCAGDRGEAAWFPYTLLADRARALIAGVRDVLTPEEDEEPECEAQEARSPHTTTRPETEISDEDRSDEDRFVASDARFAMGLPDESRLAPNRSVPAGPIRDVSSVNVQWASDVDVREAAPEGIRSGYPVPVGGAAFRISSGPGSAQSRRGRMRRSRRTR